MQNQFVVFVIGFVIGGLVVFAVVNDGLVNEEDVATEVQSITLPDSAVQLTECVPHMGFHWADPATLPAGPVYVLDGEAEVIGIEYLLLEEELEGDLSGVEQFMPAFGEGFAEVSLTYEPNGLGEVSAPLYALHLYTLSEAQRAEVCDGETLEAEPHHDTDDTPTSADNAPSGSIHNLPVPEAVDAVRALASETYDVPEGEVIVLEAHEREWPNGCLGLGGADEMCTEAIVPGYVVTVKAGNAEYTYRTNEDGSVIRAE